MRAVIVFREEYIWLSSSKDSQMARILGATLRATCSASPALTPLGYHSILEMFRIIICGVDTR